MMVSNPSMRRNNKNKTQGSWEFQAFCIGASFWWIHVKNQGYTLWMSRVLYEHHKNRWIIIMFLKMMFKNPQERTLFLGWRKKVWLWRVPSPMPPLPGNKALLGVIKGHWWFHASNLSIWPYSWGWHCGGYPAVSMISWVRKKSAWLEWCWRDVEKWLTLLWSGGEMVVLLLGDGKKQYWDPKSGEKQWLSFWGCVVKGRWPNNYIKLHLKTPRTSGMKKHEVK